MRIATLLCLAAIGTLDAADPALDVLSKRCLSCHGASKMGGLDLRNRDAALLGGGRGPALIPGKPEQSLLLDAVTGKGGLKMPPGTVSLAEAEVEALRSWIAAGAGWSTSTKAASTDVHWSFRKPVRLVVPAGSLHPIDAFIDQQLAAKGLTAAPRAGKATLIRRAYMDLVGLPPPPDRVAAFLADSSPDAWPKLIDELLKSPQYGERWGRHWLDAARYADSGGYETDIYFKNAWRYRDYVIKSFNDDKPFDRFVQEQIAGDEMWPDNLDLSGTYDIPKQKLEHLEAQVATGLYTLGPEVHESNMDSEKLQYEKLTDWVDTTSSLFMGLTFGCARCHDHKFDPIPQRDYYRLAAAFAYSTETEVPVVHRMSIRDHGQYFPKVIAVTEARTAYRLHQESVRKRLTEERKRAFTKEEIAAYDTKDEARTTQQKPLAEKVAVAVRGINIEKEMSQAEAERSRLLLEGIGKAVLDVPERDAAQGLWDGLMEIPVASVLGHRDPALVPPTFIYGRGELSLKKSRVEAGLPAFLGAGDIKFDDCSGQCVPLARKALALWLTQPEHPLTSRVIVNRVWAWHFGRGLVATPNDFGRQGSAPTLPALLDWMATEFPARKWSIKELHRLIMTSETYQRASSLQNEKNLSIDRDNLYHWRFNRRRLEGEALWDSMHSAAGTLNLQRGGPPVAPPLSPDEIDGLGSAWQWPTNADPAQHNRRGVYLLVRRNFPYPMFEAFDNPINSVSCPQRDVSSVAPQALWFLNNRVAMEQAKQFAARLRAESGPDTGAMVDRAWTLALARSPSGEEKQQAVALISRLSLEGFCLSLFNLNEFAFVD
ncbi:MAG: PSD1 and planctomycete cytochrome C domain-containing protein [Bryobacteraceae bacterium]